MVPLFSRQTVIGLHCFPVSFFFLFAALRGWARAIKRTGGVLPSPDSRISKCQMIKGASQPSLGETASALPVMEPIRQKAAPGRAYGEVAQALPSCWRLSAMSPGSTSQGKGMRGNSWPANSQPVAGGRDVSKVAFSSAIFSRTFCWIAPIWVFSEIVSAMLTAAPDPGPGKSEPPSCELFSIGLS